MNNVIVKYNGSALKFIIENEFTNIKDTFKIKDKPLEIDLFNFVKFNTLMLNKKDFELNIILAPSSELNIQKLNELFKKDSFSTNIEMVDNSEELSIPLKVFNKQYKQTHNTYSVSLDKKIYNNTNEFFNKRSFVDFNFFTDKKLKRQGFTLKHFNEDGVISNKETHFLSEYKPVTQSDANDIATLFNLTDKNITFHISENKGLKNYYLQFLNLLNISISNIIDVQRESLLPRDLSSDFVLHSKLAKDHILLLKKLEDKNNHVLFSDGSSMPVFNNLSSSAYLYLNNGNELKNAYISSKEENNNKYEEIALLKGLEYILENKKDDHDIYLVSDHYTNKDLIDGITSKIKYSPINLIRPLYNKVKNEYEKKQHNINFICIKSHSEASSFEFFNNHKVDSLTRLVIKDHYINSNYHFNTKDDIIKNRMVEINNINNINYENLNNKKTEQTKEMLIKKQLRNPSINIIYVMKSKEKNNYFIKGMHNNKRKFNYKNKNYKDFNSELKNNISEYIIPNLKNKNIIVCNDNESLEILENSIVKSNEYPELKKYINSNKLFIISSDMLSDFTPYSALKKELLLFDMTKKERNEVNKNSYEQNLKKKTQNQKSDHSIYLAPFDYKPTYGNKNMIPYKDTLDNDIFYVFIQNDKDNNIKVNLYEEEHKKDFTIPKNKDFLLEFDNLLRQNNPSKRKLFLSYSNDDTYHSLTNLFNNINEYKQLTLLTSLLKRFKEDRILIVKNDEFITHNKEFDWCQKYFRLTNEDMEQKKSNKLKYKI